MAKIQGVGNVDVVDGKPRMAPKFCRHSLSEHHSELLTKYKRNLDRRTEDLSVAITGGKRVEGVWSNGRAIVRRNTRTFVCY